MPKAPIEQVEEDRETSSKGLIKTEFDAIAVLAHIHLLDVFSLLVHNEKKISYEAKIIQYTLLVKAERSVYEVDMDKSGSNRACRLCNMHVPSAWVMGPFDGTAGRSVGQSSLPASHPGNFYLRARLFHFVFQFIFHVNKPNCGQASDYINGLKIAYRCLFIPTDSALSFHTL